MISSSKAQAATEYLLITGFVLMILIPLVYVVVNYAQESSGEVAEAQLNRIGTQIMENAENIYYFGEPSRITLDINMPEGVRSMSIHTNDPDTTNPKCTKCTELRFLLQKGRGKQDVIFSTSLPLVIDPKDRIGGDATDLDICIFDEDGGGCVDVVAGNVCPDGDKNKLSTSKVYATPVNILDPITLMSMSIYMAYIKCPAPGTWNITINDELITYFPVDGGCNCITDEQISNILLNINDVEAAWKQKAPNSVRLIFDGPEIHVNTVKMNLQYSTPTKAQIFNYTVYSPGIKKIRLQAQADNVTIGIQ